MTRRRSNSFCIRRCCSLVVLEAPDARSEILLPGGRPSAARSTLGAPERATPHESALFNATNSQNWCSRLRSTSTRQRGILVVCGADRRPRPGSAFPDARSIDLPAGVWGYDVSLRLGKLPLNSGESPLPVVVFRARKASDDRDPEVQSRGGCHKTWIRPRWRLSAPYNCKIWCWHVAVELERLM